MQNKRTTRHQSLLNNLGNANLNTKLPLDIYDLIIDHAASDIHSLRNCVLVSRAWTPRARYHLFGAVDLRRFAGDTIKAILCDPRSSVPLYVRSLHIYIYLTEAGWIPQMRELGALRELTVSHINWDKCSQKLKSRLISLIRPVKSLSLSNSSPFGIIKSLEWFRHAPNLDELSIDTFNNFDHQSMEHQCGPSVLKVLNMHAINVAIMLEGLGKCRVSTLKLRIDWRGFGMDMPGSVLDGFDPGLEHLEIRSLGIMVHSHIQPNDVQIHN